MHKWAFYLLFILSFKAYGIVQELSLHTFKSNHGFVIHSKNTKWKLADRLPHKNILAVFKSYETSHYLQPLLTVRVTKEEKTKSLLYYMERWKKDYPRFGFKIRNMKKIAIKGQNAILMDVLNQERAIRQIVFLKNRTSVVLSCRSHKKEFSSVVKSCNNIFRTFRWTSPKYNVH